MLLLSSLDRPVRRDRSPSLLETSNSSFHRSTRCDVLLAGSLSVSSFRLTPADSISGISARTGVGTTESQGSQNSVLCCLFSMQVPPRSPPPHVTIGSTTIYHLCGQRVRRFMMTAFGTRTALLISLIVVIDLFCPDAPFVLSQAPFSFNLSSCNLTFNAFDQYNGSLTRAIYDRLTIVPSVVLCPANCTQDSSSSALYGSYPYHGNSSICLAGVHAGIINDDLGGGVLVNRFYPVDWSNSSTQTIFPYNSSSGSFSNGLQSRHVDPVWYSVPSDSSNQWSYIVRGRGELLIQKRQAPFPPRAGHLHFLLDQDDSFHLIIGGHNATHYFNDVWLGVTPDLYFPADMKWFRMPDAPFTPRSHMVAQLLDYNGYRPRASTTTKVLIFGGQTNYTCGLRELGICSNEIWQLQVEQWWFNDSITSSWMLLGKFPFSSRCEPWIHTWNGLSEFPWTFVPNTTVIVIAGQESYEDVTCVSDPVTVNDVWRAEYLPGQLFEWSHLEDAPFAPRRIPAGGSSDVIGGGIRHIHVRQTATGNLTLVQSEVYADIWFCLLGVMGPVGAAVPTGFDIWDGGCRWSLSPDGMPVPTSAWALPSDGFVSKHDDDSQPSSFVYAAFGGTVSRTATRQWQMTPPRIDPSPHNLLFNITVVTSPQYGSNGTMEDLLLGRQQIPLSTILDEDELNDEHGYYVLGSDYVQSWAGTDRILLTLRGRSYDRTTSPVVPASTCHYQPRAFFDQPQDSTAFVPQAESSLNTSRPLLNFLLRRLGHRVVRFQVFTETFISTLVSGGTSGTTFNNDWILMSERKCFPPTDPSFSPYLGPLQIVADESEPSAQNFFVNLFAVGVKLRVTCPTGFHIEPYSDEPEVVLQCAPNGMWMDYDALTIRGCTRDELNCPVPLKDLGNGYCEPALPVIYEIRGSYAGSTKSVERRNDVTLFDVPVTGGVQLTIMGNLFVQPVRVSVQGYPCEQVLLQYGEDEPHHLCYNVTATDGETSSVCIEVGTTITCVMERALLGVQMPIAVTTRLGVVTEVDPSFGNIEVATLTSRPPSIVGISSDDCQQQHNEPLNLYDCPIRNASQVTIYADPDSVGTWPVQTFLSSNSKLPLNCTSWVPAGYLSDVFLCANCTMLPKTDTVHLMLLHPSVGLTSHEPATLSFEGCPSGFKIASMSTSQNATDLCIICPAGSSTNNVSSAYDCTACPAGQYSNVTGSPMCLDCAPGSYSDGPNATRCELCSPNSYQNYTRQTRCEECDLNEYIVYADPADLRIAGQCTPCPAMANCYRNGNVTSAAGSYLLIDQSAGTLSTISCSSSACVDGSSCLASLDDAQLIPISKLRAINCCASGRWPAFSSQDIHAYPDFNSLKDTKGHNVLCASCLPGYSSINGRCIPCESTQYGAVVAILSLALFLVYLVHRLPHDWTGSATLLISTYFLQQSALFMASESMPQVLSLINLDLLGDHISRGYEITGAVFDSSVGFAGVCIVPLDDADRITMSLVSPLIAFGLLGTVLLLQLAVSSLLRRFPNVSAFRMYRLLFVPSQPKLLLPGEEPAVSVRQLSTSLLREAPAPAFQEETLRRSPLAYLERLPSQATPLDLSTSSIWRGYQRSCIRLVQLSYTGLSVVTLSFFHLLSVGEFGWRLVDYPTISPNSEEYRAMLPFIASVLAIVVCGLPLALVIFLFIEHRRGSIEEAKTLQRQSGSSMVSHKQALLLQLTAMFRPQYWWMASFVLVRRLLLVALLVSVRGSDVWTWLSMVNFCLLALHVQLQPYERAVDNTLESLTLLSLSVQTTLLSVWPPPYLSRALFGVLNALVIAPLVPVIAVVILAGWRRHNAKQESRLEDENGLR